MNKVLFIVFIGLSVSDISCSDKYVVVGVPTLKSLCKPALEKDFYKKADQLFTIVKKTEFNEADEQQLQELLEYNYKMQHDPYIQANIQLSSLLHLANKIGYTPLHLAAYYNADKTTPLLLAAGANVNACDSSDETPLHRAARSNADKTTMQLLTAKANIDACNKYGGTPLHCAACNNADKTTSLLLTAGANVDAQNEDGDTPLHCAAYYNADKVTPLLLAAGANVDAQDKYGGTPLHFAAYHNAYKTTPLLLAAGANVDAQNRNGETPSVRTKSCCTIS